MKLHPKLPWSFRSKRFHDQKFVPANPTNYKSANVFHTVASLLLRMYYYGEVDNIQLSQVIQEIKDNDAKLTKTNVLILQCLEEAKISFKTM